MSTRIERARALYDLGKYHQAEKVLRQVLHESPDFSYAHALSAMCLAHTKRPDEAIDEARRSIACAPGNSYAHYSLAFAYYKQDELEAACAAIEETVRLSPDWDAGFSLKASILFNLHRWQAALEASDQALALNPENVDCTHTRVLALLRLGQYSEADSTIRTALRDHPDNANTHACMGWVVLKLHGSEAALFHFREALRIDPSNEFAFDGMEELSTYENDIYRGAVNDLCWFAGCSTLTHRFMMFDLIAFAGCILLLVSVEFPHGAKWIGTLLTGLCLLAMLIFLIPYQLLNLTLRIDTLGDKLLSDRERIEANWIIAFLLLSFPAVLLQLQLQVSAGSEGATIDLCSDSFLDWVLYLCFVLPVSITVRVKQGWARRMMLLLVTAITIIGYGGLILASSVNSSSLAGYSLMIALVLAFVSLLIPDSAMKEGRRF